MDPSVPTFMKFVVGGAAGCSGWMFVHPMDVTKLRMQISGEGSTVRPHLHTVVRNIWAKEGIAGFYSGISAAIARQLSYGTLRIGIYDSMRDTLSNGKESLPLWKKAVSGLTAGAVAATLATPVEVCLVRMQADGKLPPEKRRNYNGFGDALKRIATEEGIAAYWRGATPTVVRAMIVSMVQLATYDQAKHLYLSFGLFSAPTSVSLHFAASLTSGFLYSLASLPLDIAKTRMQYQQPLPNGTLPYKNIFQTIGVVATKESPTALWKGFLPYFMRSGGHTILMFLFLEQYRNIANAMFKK